MADLFVEFSPAIGLFIVGVIMVWTIFTTLRK
jgi:hypothetical protein